MWRVGECAPPRRQPRTLLVRLPKRRHHSPPSHAWSTASLHSAVLGRMVVDLKSEGAGGRDLERKGPSGGEEKGRGQSGAEGGGVAGCLRRARGGE
jgi:hypothetical protein